MLKAVCDNIHNYFAKKSFGGEYTIADGMIALDFLKDGQRFLIKGSDLNDGMYTYHEDYIMDDDDTGDADLQDETFTGVIYPCSIPADLKNLALDILSWVDDHKKEIDSPYTSENVIGVYSYTKGSGDTDSSDWKVHFKSRLDAYRKVAL